MKCPIEPLSDKVVILPYDEGEQKYGPKNKDLRRRGRRRERQREWAAREAAKNKDARAQHQRV